MHREDGPAVGSIPAGAGEPTHEIKADGSQRVYPRGCGGTEVRKPMADAGLGLSPRVRGNRPRGRYRPRY